MKRCIGCGIEKTLDSYHKRVASKDGLANKCKECIKTDTREYYSGNSKRIRAARVNTYKKKTAFIKLVKESVGCSCCDEVDAVVLDFHHEGYEKKSFALGSNGADHSFKMIIEEMKKCIVVCANCHRRIHAK